ncbi:aminoacyl-histidine dipeptidase [Lactonifactor longoviformis]|uniref:Cytosol non-specific dipeptidase n=1 Tax=Lactonifactor longoviformis DSM 17459 TaxID=1122155 RepID=A0A1M4WUZ8_9CLOT|nr:aminoacyl-histidine dipeptidase [Lactonifactor longoviformis]POP31037.1 aminoacyl-histidine dipeptidase [Lactonifactor longoviformis]SHE85025.1 dipeptidase D [Lactonifactor longoviformis DSM 17459]
MAKLEGIEPVKVFRFFEELAGIPHGSGNTKEISDYLVRFAKARGLRYIQDSNNNVIIFQEGTPGYENAPVVILQGHMDMVCEKKPGSLHDFTKDGLKLQAEGDFISAKDTTLGADDGIAVAYALAVLDDDKLPHPPLEVVVTVDEEIGLLGAGSLDASPLKGKLLLNLDSEEESCLWVGCAGGLTAVSRIPVRYIEEANHRYGVKIHGLCGGHSGAEIDKIRANAVILMGRFLFELREHVGYLLSELKGGQKDNAIPREASALLMLSEEEEERLFEAAAGFQEALRKEYAGTDEGITVTVERLGMGTEPALHPGSLEKVIFYLMHIPNGILKMSGTIPGLVESSTNLGILELTPNELRASSSVRSSVKSGKTAIAERIQYLTEFLGGDYEAEGEYPAWEYRQDSPLRELMVQVYKDLFQKEPQVKAVHAGLECGLFFEKIPGLDCISFGPDIFDIHTTEEHLSISSTKRVWEYLCTVLERIR